MNYWALSHLGNHTDYGHHHRSRAIVLYYWASLHLGNHTGLLGIIAESGIHRPELLLDDELGVTLLHLGQKGKERSHLKTKGQLKQAWKSMKLKTMLPIKKTFRHEMPAAYKIWKAIFSFRKGKKIGEKDSTPRHQ
ncbi:hypothetical protein CEXT_650561 [Caerostris extrusa]|uniref:Uncharacterized protein n=1 Tax=Caerostris extrusa TaxID=172846 RepID=A0AAV4PT27_CAEEX|nr:hypothetical protein CEXT_650561 [Caerostris extrusa]